MSSVEIRIRDYQRIVFFTGAGMSVESGVPTYRGAGGIWKEYDYERYACQSAFDADPELVWEFHNYRRELVGACAPNPGHLTIAELEASRSVTVVTQNIDGLHQLAGSQDVVELHGGLWRIRCDHCDNHDSGRQAPLETLRCPACGQYWRPDIVWFGDALHRDVLRAAAQAASEADLFIAIGTSAVVYPAAALPTVAKDAGAICVEINPEDTPMSDLYDVRLRGTATEMLAKLAAGA